MTYDIPDDAINEALGMLPEKMDSTMARIMMIAIGLQESRFKYRKQIGGPAKGWAQFERNGGVRGVMNHHSSKSYAVQVCSKLGVPFNTTSVYNALEHDDVLAAAFARLLLWTDPHSLPQIDDVDGAWDYYIRNWRPGKPHRHTWDELYQYAVGHVL